MGGEGALLVIALWIWLQLFLPWRLPAIAEYMERQAPWPSEPELTILDVDPDVELPTRKRRDRTVEFEPDQASFLFGDLE